MQSLGQPGEEQEEQKREARERECPVTSAGSRCLRERWPEQDGGREGWSFCYNIGLLIHKLKLPERKRETLRKARGPAEEHYRMSLQNPCERTVAGKKEIGSVLFQLLSQASFVNSYKTFVTTIWGVRSWNEERIFYHSLSHRPTLLYQNEGSNNRLETHVFPRAMSLGELTGVQGPSCSGLRR